MTFCLGRHQEREAVLVAFKHLGGDVKSGPPPPGPLERKLQKELEALLKKK